MNRNGNRINIDSGISNINDNMKTYEKILTSLADQLSYAKEDHDNEFVDKSINDLLISAQKVTELQYKCDITSNALHEFSNKSITNTNTNTNSNSSNNEPVIEDGNILCTRLKNKIDEDFLKNIKKPNTPSKSKFILNIKEILEIDTNNNKKQRLNGDDDEIEELYVEPTEGSFKCCCTQMIMNTPMKK